MRRSLDDKTAFITGAGQGVGLATALRLGSLGADVAVVDVAVERAEAAAAALTESGIEAAAVVADVTDYAGVGNAVASTLERFGRIDIVVNNAGNVGASGEWTLDRFWETEPAQWKAFIDVNLYGVLNCCRQALPSMIEQGDGGRLITVVSDAARTGEPRLEAYAAAKAGAAGFMRSIAKAVGRYGITANSVALGTLANPFYDAMTPDELSERLSNYAIRRPGQPDEAAALIAHLAGPDAEWITGQTYVLNGGASTS